MTPYGAPYTAPADAAGKAKAGVIAGIRAFGSATASLRMDPDYLVIGTKRGGTTSMARWLLEHPDVRPLFPARETRKGTYFFDVNYGRGHAWYRSHFPTRIGHQLTSRNKERAPLIGDATPYYLHHPEAPGRAAQLVPNAKVIALLRDPIDRAYGHWAERTRNGVETLSFADALAAEAERLVDPDPARAAFAHQHWSYLDQGKYVDGVRRWMSAFPADQLLILKSEDLYAEPAVVFGQTLDFLGLPPFEPAAFAAWNKKDKEPIAPEQRAWLTEQLAPSITELEELLQRKMGWNGA